MKKILTRIKKSLINNEKMVLAVCIVITLSVVWGFTKEVQYNAETLDTQRNLKFLNFQLDDVLFNSEEKNRIIQIQSEILSSQRNQLIETEKVLETQHKLIQRLFKELENLGALPGQRFDPKRSI